MTSSPGLRLVQERLYPPPSKLFKMTTTDFCDTFIKKEIEIFIHVCLPQIFVTHSPRKKIFIQVDREPAGCEERLCGGNNWIFISQ